MNRSDFSHPALHPRRNPVPPPPSLVDATGSFQYGTFCSALPNLNPEDVHRPYNRGFSKRQSRNHLKDWEAVEVAFDEGFLVSAVYRTGYIAFNVLIFHDRQTGEIFSWEQKTLGTRTQSHESLLSGVHQLQTRKSLLQFDNDLLHNRISCQFRGEDCRFPKQIQASYAFTLTGVSDPSVVSLPMVPNAGLYTHKQMFRAEGWLRIGDREYLTRPHTLAIVDDHRGFYPRTLRYHWLTGIGQWGSEELIGFNLTENQAQNPDAFNENLIWLRNDSYTLPPVRFQISASGWEVQDREGLVDVRLRPDAHFRKRMELGLFCIRYDAPFGRLEGKLCTTDGQVFDVSKLCPMGENKVLRL